jgi:V/A-type H+-transporting ATPase subunit I
LSLLSKISLNKPDIALRAYVVTPRESTETLVEELVRKGLFEPLPPQEAGKALEIAKKRYELSEKALGLFRELSSLVKKKVEVEVKELPWDTDKALEKLVADFEELKDAAARLISESEKLKGKLEKLKALRVVVTELSRKEFLDKSLLDYEGVYLASKTLYGSVKDLEYIASRSLKTIFHSVLSEERAVAVVLLEKKVYESNKPHIEKLEIPVRDLVRDEEPLTPQSVDNLIREVEAELSATESKLEELLESRLYELALLKVLAEIINSELGVLGKALSSKYMAVVAGWTLKSRVSELEKIVSASSGYVVYEADPNPPVDFNNLKPFKPFELLTEVMGLPSPSEWDPTPLLTYFYLIFFSLMFPDVGYSIGLIIGARLVLPYFVDNKETLKKLINIATYAGIVGCITGLLANSFFGSLLGSYIGLIVPKLLPSIPAGLSDPIAMKSAVIGYIALALILGYYVVLFAHILGALKNAIARNKFGFLFELLTMLIMVFGPASIQASIGLSTDVWGLLRFMSGKDVIYSTILLIVIYSILRSVFDKPFGAILWLFDVIGLLADVLSFVRIAGIALGSAMLAEIFNGLILNVYSSLSSLSFIVGVLAGALITVILHIVNLGFSSLSPFIHSLRLVMYELSSKFYEGSGRRISPAATPLLRVKIGTMS